MAHDKLLRQTSNTLAACILATAALLLASCANADASALYEKKCSSCHTLESIEDARGRFASEQAWRDQIAEMQKKTDTISDDDAEIIAAYLAQNS